MVHPTVYAFIMICVVHLDRFKFLTINIRLLAFAIIESICFFHNMSSEKMTPNNLKFVTCWRAGNVRKVKFFFVTTSITKHFLVLMGSPALTDHWQTFSHSSTRLSSLLLRTSCKIVTSNDRVVTLGRKTVYYQAKQIKRRSAAILRSEVKRKKKKNTQSICPRCSSWGKISTLTNFPSG